MKRQIFAFFAAIAALVSCSQKNGGLDAIHVDGNRFVDESGQTVVFKGLCLADPVKLLGEGQWSDRIFAEAEDWGSNIVRFAIHPAHINAMGWDETFAAIDEGIELAKLHGQYVILDWHSIGSLCEEKYQSAMYNTTIEETFRFWKTAAERYGDEPAVALFELFNEPTFTVENAGMRPVEWSEWKALMESLIDAIREIAPEKVCLVAGFNWAYDLTPVASAPIERDNIAYVSHPYPMKREAPWPEKWESDFGFVADSYPVVCTEIGYCLENEKGAHIPVMADDAYGEEITKYLDSKCISFTIWCFDPDWAPMLIEDWEYTPTTQGRFFRNYLRGHKAATAETGTGVEDIRTGDLLFVGVPADHGPEGGMSDAIAAATGNGDVNFIHVAILEVDDSGAVWVIDATPEHGVDRHPLDTLLKDFALSDGSQPHYEVMRLPDNSGAETYLSNAKSYLGEEYDQWFLPDNGKHYCSELVQDSYKDSGEPFFVGKPMNFKDKDGEFPLYWKQLFDLLGQEIPQGVPGTNPQDMHADPRLVPVIQFI